MIRQLREGRHRGTCEDSPRRLPAARSACTPSSSRPSSSSGPDRHVSMAATSGLPWRMLVRRTSSSSESLRVETMTCVPRARRGSFLIGHERLDSRDSAVRWTKPPLRASPPIHGDALRGGLVHRTAGIPGIKAFVADEWLPRLARGTHVIVSILGSSLKDYVRLTSILQGRPEVAAIETSLSGPDEELDHGRELGVHADRAAGGVGAVCRMSLGADLREATASTAPFGAMAQAVTPRRRPRPHHRRPATGVGCGCAAISKPALDSVTS